MDKFSFFKKCFTVVASAIITIVVFVFMIKMAVEGNTFSEYGFEFDEQYVFFLYAALSMLICSLVDFISYYKNGVSNKTARLVGPSLASAFLLGYYSKVFFKALNKYGTQGFSSTNLIFVLILLSLTIYSFANLIKYTIDKLNVAKEN